MSYFEGDTSRYGGFGEQDDAPEIEGVGFTPNDAAIAGLEQALRAGDPDRVVVVDAYLPDGSAFDDVFSGIAHIED